MADEDYEKRDNTVRQWKKQQQQQLLKGQEGAKDEDPSHAVAV